MMGWGPRCYISSFVEISSLVQEKEILRFFSVYGRGGHLGHVTSIILMNFHFLVFKFCIPNLVKNGLVVSEKSFNFHMKMTFGQGQEMTVILNTHIPSLT